MTHPLPNLYGFATKELAQDAAIAYILAWADQEYRGAPAPDSGMHALGTALLRALVTSHPDRRDWSPEKVTSVEVETQEKRVDVRAHIEAGDEKVFLIVEDKIHAGEHGRQIRRYVEEARKRYDESEIVPVYVKTGNESPNHRADHLSIEKCGIFLRDDLLAVLDEHPGTGNRIVDDLRDNWRAFDDHTRSFRNTPPAEWDWQQYEGYLLELEKRLGEVGIRAGWKRDTIRGSATYLHLFCGAVTRPDGNETRIQIRTGVRGVNLLSVQALRNDGRVDSDTLRRLFDEYQALEPHLPGGRIHRSGKRFRSGVYPMFMKITFDDEGEQYVATDANGRVDLDETVARIVRVKDFLRDAADRSGAAD